MANGFGFSRTRDYKGHVQSIAVLSKFWLNKKCIRIKCINTEQNLILYCE